MNEIIFAFYGWSSRPAYFYPVLSTMVFYSCFLFCRGPLSGQSIGSPGTGWFPKDGVAVIEAEAAVIKGGGDCRRLGQVARPDADLIGEEE